MSAPEVRKNLSVYLCVKINNATGAVICCARVIKIPFLILLSSLYANKVQKRSLRSLHKTAEREAASSGFCALKPVITHVLLVHDDGDDDEKKVSPTREKKHGGVK